MRPLDISRDSLARLLDSGVVEFLDLGCGAGGSYEFIRRHTNLRVGLSLDVSEEKVRQCREANDLSFTFDVGKLPKTPGTVSAAFCVHFLEHIEEAQTVFRIIESALTATRDFLIVRQPFFDHDEALAALGCTTYWSNWSGHKTKLTCAMVDRATDRLQRKGLLYDYTVAGIDRIDNTGHPAILPLKAPPDQHDYDAEAHGPKTIAPIGFACFREIFITFRRSTISRQGYARLAQITNLIGPRMTPLRSGGTRSLDTKAA